MLSNEAYSRRAAQSALSTRALAIAVLTGTLSACGGGSGGGGSGGGSSSVAAAAPTVSISVTPTTVTAGTSALVTWSSTGATQCAAGSGWSAESLSGTQNVAPASAGVFTYSLSCSGPGGSASGSATLKVTPAPVPPSLSFNISPGTVAAGQSAMLTWTTAGITSCTASNAWTGNVALNGSAPTAPTTPGSYAYLISCAVPPGGTTVASANLTVTAEGFSQTALVASASAVARATDAQLLDPWGIVFPEKQALVVANALGNSSTSYDGSGAAQQPGAGASGLTVQLPTGSGGAAFSPTGVVAISGGFTLTAGAKSGAVQLIYAGESGAIAAWSPQVDPVNAIIVYTDTAGAVYRGLALAGNLLYAADFHNNKVDVFDATFTKQASSATSYAFADPALPPGYAPFGIYANGNTIYGSYAMQSAPANRDAASGAGLGVVDSFDVNGNFLARLVGTGGVLNAPWGMTLAPARGPGAFGAALLVANTGDGRINAFNASTGTSMGTLSDPTGAPITIAGLHGLAFGNRYANQPDLALFFTSGASTGTGGLARLDFAAPPRLHAPPSIALETSVTPGVRRLCCPIETWPPWFRGGCAPYSGRLCRNGKPPIIVYTPPVARITANVSSIVGGIARADFYDSGSYAATANSAPYERSFSGQVTASRFSATVTDVDGNVASAP